MGTHQRVMGTLQSLYGTHQQVMGAHHAIYCSPLLSNVRISMTEASHQTVYGTFQRMIGTLYPHNCPSLKKIR
jgi:hypothetical protein